MAETDAIRVAGARRIHNLNILVERVDPCLPDLKKLPRSVGAVADKASWTVRSKVHKDLCESFLRTLETHASVREYSNRRGVVGWELKLPGRLLGGGKPVTCRGYELYGGSSHGDEPDTTLVRVLRSFLPLQVCTSPSPTL